MVNKRFVLACRDYDRTRGILDGTITPAKFEIQLVEMNNVADTFTGMYQGKYDASEFSLAELVYHLSRNTADFLAIPIFPLRMFRHNMIFLNTLAHVKKPEDLRGKRIGLFRLAQTACIWMRGLLADEYNVLASDVTWYTPSIHHWDDDAERSAMKPRDGSVIRWVHKTEGESNLATLEKTLLAGEIDALCTAVKPSSYNSRDQRIQRLFGNYRDVEAAYYRKTGIFPIMHTIVLQRSAVEERPELPENLFELFCRAKQLAHNWLAIEGRVGLIWKDFYLECEEQDFGRQAWQYGLKINEHVIETFLGYCYDQGISARRLTPTELFFSGTWDLTDDLVS
jgi:4,5-dihydroxyphthalate decarboxylase